ncbi:alpha/beta fold hydrolase [Streptomyces sp. NPDC018833]|uniref:alpha/beta fold hydrolase n=1 Tax=Streptomyces sp. NPDC018833 TaxID=3365053 RepID=UPI0037B801F7
MRQRVRRRGGESGGYAQEVLSKMVAPYNIKALPGVAHHVMGMMARTSPEGAAAALRGRAERPDYVEMLARIAVSTLVVVGADDEFTPVSDARVISDGIPDAELEVIQGAAHMPNLERAAEFDVALQRFLDSLPAEADKREER